MESCADEAEGEVRALLTSTMLGCCKLSRMLISRMDVTGKPSSTLFIFTFFSATMRPVALSRALRRRGAHAACQRCQSVR